MTNNPLKYYTFEHIYHLKTNLFKLMSIKINYSNKPVSKNSSNIVLFCNEKFNLNSLRKFLSDYEFNYINDLLKTSDLKKNLLLFLNLNSKKKIVLISIKNNFKTSEIESLGAEFFGRINYGKNNEYFVISDSIKTKHDNFLGYFLHGLKLKSYDIQQVQNKKGYKINIY